MLALAQGVPVRQVTHTVFDVAGKPAAHAQVTAAYCVGRAATFQHATTDAGGIAIWKDLPALPVIVWGEGIPAGVIPAAASTVTTPLAAPKPQEKVNVSFVSDGIGKGAYTAFLVRQNNASIIGGSGYGRDNRQLTAGVPTTLNAVSLEPCGYAGFGTVYLPYPAEGNTVEFTFTFTRGPLLNGRFQLANGTPVNGVSKIGVLPVEVEGFTPTEVRALQRQFGLFTNAAPLFFYPDGHFAVQVPAPGTYRLLVDLFDENMPSLPALTRQIKAGTQEATITLPAPFATVPAGSQLFWMAQNAPCNPQRLLVPAMQPQMPIFGPKDAILALWYQPTPNVLQVCAGTGGMRQLTKRQVRLAVTTPDGTPYADRMGPRVSLLPLFPPVRFDNSMPWDSRTNYHHLPEFSRLRADGYPWQVALWTGNYLLMVGPEGLYGMPDMDNVKFIQPITISADGPAEITVKDPGTPPLSKPTDPAEAPAPPLCTIGGRLLNPDGTPMANVKFTIRSSMPELRKRDPHVMRQIVTDKVSVNGATDADGHFSVANAPSGAAILVLQPAGRGYTDKLTCWQFVVPLAGANDLTLSALANPLSIFLERESAAGAQIWWVPDKGIPWRIPAIGQYAYTNTVPRDAGYIWIVNSFGGTGKCLRSEPAIPFSTATAPTLSSPLGIYLPLDITQGFPGAVTLTGSGDAQGMRVVILSPSWAPSSILNRMVGQVDAVPPGSYTVTVETAKGPLTKTVTVTASGGSVQF